MSRIPFPAAAPTESVVAIPQMVLNGTWKTEKRTFAEHVWTVQGFGMGLVLKNNGANESATLRSAMNTQGVSDEQYDKMFNALCDVHDELDPSSPAARKAFNPLMIMQIIRLIMDLLEKSK